jgi:hypothetical protein
MDRQRFPREGGLIDAVRAPRADGLGPGFHGLGKGFDGGQRLVFLDEANRRVDKHHTEDKDRLDILLENESDGAA